MVRCGDTNGVGFCTQEVFADRGLSVSRFDRSRPLTGPEAEQALVELLDDLETAAEDLADKALAAAAAESAYRRAHARAVLTSGHKTDSLRQAQGVNACGPQLEARDRTAAEVVGAAELCRVRRTQVEAVRSILASARAAEYGK